MTGETKAKLARRARLAWLSTLSEASAGALGQLCSTLLLYPLDTSKTRVQASLDEGSRGAGEGEGESEAAARGEGAKDASSTEAWKEWALSLYVGIETKVSSSASLLARSGAQQKSRPPRSLFWDGR